jgi:hypothetical protein
VKYAWILGNREVYSIPMMCELLGVSRSGLHAAAKRERSERRLEEAEVVEQIRQAQTKHKGRYGRRRMTPEVSEALGRRINHKRIGRLMREHDLRSRKRRPFRVRTTDSRHSHRKRGFLDHQAEAAAPLGLNAFVGIFQRENSVARMGWPSHAMETIAKQPGVAAKANGVRQSKPVWTRGPTSEFSEHPKVSAGLLRGGGDAGVARAPGAQGSKAPSYLASL